MIISFKELKSIFKGIPEDATIDFVGCTDIDIVTRKSLLGTSTKEESSAVAVTLRNYGINESIVKESIILANKKYQETYAYKYGADWTTFRNKGSLFNDTPIMESLRNLYGKNQFNKIDSALQNILSLYGINLVIK